MSLLKQNVLREIAKAVEADTKGCGRGKQVLAGKVAECVSRRSRSREPSSSIKKKKKGKKGSSKRKK